MASSVDSGHNAPCEPEPWMKSWPELVGTNGEAAAEKIKKENPELNVIVLPEGSPTTKDLRRDRVWIFVDPKGNVAVTPKTG